MKKNTDGDIAIKVTSLSKSFKIPIEPTNRFKHQVIGLLRGNRGYREFTPLKDISLEIKKGEFFGIVGRNGSGKSTLLKTIAGIYTPNKGKVEINGSLVPFIELGVGFNQELSGRENVYLNGALLGFSTSEIDAIYDEIVDFAELHDFMEEKLKNYSSGMQVRLAFSVAIQARSDILLLDEVLAVGDEAFQRKCFEYFAQLKREKRTVILVTHDMNSVQRFCSRAVLINEGRVEVIGSTIKVTNRYQELNLPKDKVQKDKNEALPNENGRITVEMFVGGKRKNNITGNTGDRMRFVCTVNTKIDIENAFFGFTIRKDDGTPVFWYTTEKPHQTVKVFCKNKPVRLYFDIQNIFGDGKYFVDVSVKSDDRTKEYIIQNQVLDFLIAGWGRNGWMLHPDVAVRISD